MSSDAQREAARIMAARIIAMAEDSDADSFATNAAAIIAGTNVSPRVADRVLDQHRTLLNPLLGPHGISLKRLARTKRIRFHG